MAAALSSIVTNQNTKSAIMQALKSDLGKRTVWVIVEAEDDYNVYLTYSKSAYLFASILVIFAFTIV